MHHVQQRTQALVLSAALAVSGILPGAAAAQESDQDREGTAAPEPQTPPDSTANPDFDPGPKTDLPFSLDLRGGGGDDDLGDGAPVDVEPVTDPDALAVPLDDPTAMAPDVLGDTDEPVPPAEPAPPVPLPAPAPVPATPPPAATTPPVDADRQATGDRRHAARAKRDTARKRDRDRGRQRPAVRVTIPAPAVTPAPTPAPVATATAEPAQTATTEPSRRARSGQRTHTVQPGESLWTIASDLLGPDATDADVGAEVDRLYQLNRDRIGPDPDLLIAGTVLRSR
jgi:hypothetical protein